MSESDIVKDFLIESHENLDRLDRELVELEKNPANKDALASIFRTIHTIKGTCGFLAFNKLEKLTHVGENLLSRLRDGALTLTPEITTALLDTVDAVRQMLDHIEREGSEGERNDGPLIDTLTTLQQVPAAQASEQTGPSIGEILMERAGVSQEVILQAAEKQKKGDPRHLGEILVEQKAVRPSDVVEALRIQQSSRASGGVLDSSVRVDVHLLDKLMNLVGELVLARNQVLQYGKKIKDRNFMAASQRLNLITTELQEGVMKTRMQPIGNIWGQFPRTVRDVALACGKQVVIEMEGKETELDKTIIEAIKDPLTHLVRNSVDHGIESPEARARAGKDATGRVMLRASHEGGQVHIEICDDGAGLDSERIRQKVAGQRAGQCRAGNPHDRPGHRQSYFYAGLFDRGESQQGERPGSGNGCSADQHRKDRGHGGCAVEAGPGHYGTHENSSDAGHYSRTNRDRGKRALCHPAGVFARTGASGSRASRQQNRTSARRAGASAARTIAAAGFSRTGPGRRTEPCGR
jgi:two-component system chemotaxis sensor kinase CheA